MCCHDSGCIPYIGGDLNSRVGNFAMLKSSSWQYVDNVDVKTNKHGRTFFKDLCYACNVMPINGLRYKNLKIDNDFTYVGGNGSSQIDFALTDIRGRSNINKFEIINSDWHLSDHKPISLEIAVKSDVDLSYLLSRAQNLNTSNIDVNNRRVPL